MLFLSGICGVLAFLAFLSYSMDKKRRRTIMFMEIYAAILLLADRFSYIFRGDTSPLGFWMVKTMNFIAYLMMLFIMFGYNSYLGDLYTHEGNLKKMPVRLYVSYIFLDLGLILLIVSQFTGLYYTIDENNLYNQNAWEATDPAHTFVNNWLEDQKWHYYTAVFTETNAKIFLDGEVKNEWNVDGVTEGQVINGLFNNGSDLKYICLGGNQAWDWNDNDAPFRFARLLIKNSQMTAGEIKAQMLADFPGCEEYLVSGIESMRMGNTNMSGASFNLAGQRVSDSYKGIVIQNGKKMIRK